MCSIIRKISAIKREGESNGEYWDRIKYLDWYIKSCNLTASFVGGEYFLLKFNVGRPLQQKFRSGISDSKFFTSYGYLCSYVKTVKKNIPKI